MNNSTTHTHRTHVEGPLLAECPDDGGKWAIYCDHFDASDELIGSGLLQDTNKQRLRAWKRQTLMWCCYCQDEDQEAAR